MRTDEAISTNGVRPRRAQEVGVRPFRENCAAEENWRRRAPRLTVAVLALLTLAFPCLLAAQDAASLQTSLTARAMQPGEVVRLDVMCRCQGVAPIAAALGATVPLFPLSDTQWRGLIGIDLETTPGSYDVTVTLQPVNQPPVVSRRAIVIAPKRFPIRRLRVAPRFVDPPDSARARIETEAVMLNELYQRVTPRAWDAAFRLPVAQPPNSNFGARSVFNGQSRNPHGGVDFASPAGTPIAAPGGGHVAVASDLYFTGNTVIVDHGLGLYSIFAHLSAIAAQRGDLVERGTILGNVGATGRVTGPHLHWSVRLHNARVDPLSLVAALQDRINTKDTKDTKKRKANPRPKP